VLSASIHNGIKDGDDLTDDLGAQGLESVLGGHGSRFVVEGNCVFVCG
jgi:hypothetical protein